MVEPPTSLEEGVAGIFEFVMMEGTSGGFGGYEGVEIPW
jgi:hypothetical protein